MIESQPKVFFLPIEKLNAQNLLKLFDTAGFTNIIEKNKLVAIKVHFGEIGNTAYLKPDNVRPIVEKIISLGAKPFLTDANTLYKGTRSNAVDHINTALSHDYRFAPVVIADGLNGKDYEKIKIDLKHFKEVHISSAAVHSDAIIAMTHFKGHELSGFGGALKNIGMGFGSRSGKQQMHSDIHPKINEDICNACALCIEWCPEDAIEMKNNTAVIDSDKCTGCGECVVTCKNNSIEISWSGEPDSVQEKIAEYVFGAVKAPDGIGAGKKCGCFNFIKDVSPECDCYNFTNPPIVKDIGVLASLDPVAIDQASVDLVNKAAGEDIIKKTWPNIDYTVQLKYGEKIGLGSRKYELFSL